MANLLNIQRVSAITSLSDSTIERIEEAGLFPKSVRPTAHRRAWVEDEVLAWNRDRIAARDQQRDPARDPVLVATAGKRGLGRRAA